MAQMMLVNPRKRRKAAKKKTAKRRRTTLARARSRAPVRRRRRNPIKMDMASIMKNTIMPSATAAGGAIAVDLALGYLPLPAMMKTGPVRHLVKGVAAISMGLLAANFVKPRTAELFATGAMTVALYDAAKEGISNFAPNIRMGEYDDLDVDLEMGYASPAPVVGVDDDSELSYYEEQQEIGAYDDDIHL